MLFPITSYRVRCTEPNCKNFHDVPISSQEEYDTLSKITDWYCDEHGISKAMADIFGRRKMPFLYNRDSVEKKEYEKIHSKDPDFNNKYHPSFVKQQLRVSSPVKKKYKHDIPSSQSSIDEFTQKNNKEENKNGK